MVLTIVIFIIALSLLVIVHEAGHFFAAKKFGMKVEEFGIGFPPRVWGVRRGETLYSINALPIGGFVRILGEGGEEEDNPRSFSSRGPGQRFLVLAAGVLVNLFVAYVIFTAIYALGTPQQAVITGVVPDSPAAESGLREGDIIVAAQAGDVRIAAPDSDGLSNLLDQREPNEQVVFEVIRESGAEEVTVTPTEDSELLGIEYSGAGIARTPWYQAPWYGFLHTVSIITLTFSMLGGILKEAISGGGIPEGVGGPVGIANVAVQLRDFGWLFFLNLMGIVSLSLAFFNSLPIPALDGGRMLFVIIEKIKGSPVNRKVENAIHMGGFAVLIVLILLITLNDIQNLGS